MADAGLSAALYFRVLLYLWLVYSSAGSCDQLALGLEGGFISDSKITSSSPPSASTPAKNGRLNYTAGSSWCAAASDTSPFLQIDLLTRHIICAVSTQGNSKADQWVKTYKLQSSDNGTDWKDYEELGNTKTFVGNFDRNTPVKHILHMGITAKYLRFVPQSHKGVRCLRVELYGVLQKQGNLAFLKPTDQSSTLDPFDALRAVDGSRGTTMRTCSHTDSRGSNDPWWRVDLGEVEPVSELFIVNRGDCCGLRLNNFEILVGNNTAGSGASNHLCGRDLSVPQGQGKSFFCEPTAYGKYVYIRLPGNNKILALCEVEVYPTRRINRALKHPASQSSRAIRNKGFAAWAVDGNDATSWSQNSCTHTRKESNPWWRVDLGSSIPVTDVFIVNRGDCDGACANRLSGFEIRIGNDDQNGGTSNSPCGSGLSLGKGEKRAFICRPRLVGRYVYIRIPGNNKTLTICELKVYSGYTACEIQAVGVEDSSKIPDYRFSASSSRSGNEPSNGRLRGSNAWVSNTNNNDDEYLQIDLGSVYFVCGVATQGNPGAGEWTKKYKIKTSLNNTVWTVYKEDNKAKEFVGNSDQNSIIKRKLNQPPVAKFIRFHPVSFSSRKALRVEVYGSVESCQSSLGMESSTLLDSKINASSSLDPGHSASFGRLYGSSSWCSSSSSASAYLQMDLGQVKTVTGVATQGDPSSNKWVTKYDISYGYNGKTWNNGAAYQGLPGNSDGSNVVVHWLSLPFAARYVKIIPEAHGNSVCLRVELYGCEHFIVPYLYVEDPADVILPTRAIGSSVQLGVKAEFIKERPAVFTWSNKGKVLSESTSSLTITYSGAANTWNNFHCLSRSLSIREVDCNASYSCSVSLQGMEQIKETVHLNVTAVLKTPGKPPIRSFMKGDIKARSTTVKWTKPSTGSDEAPITSFKLQYFNTTFTSAEHILSPDAKSKVLTNLKPYAGYSVKVMATSILGDGLWSDTKTFKTSSAAPEVAPLVTNLTATSSKSIYVEWKKPELDKINGPRTEYKVVYRDEGAAPASVKSVGSGTSVTLKNLKIWTKYKVQLRVNNGDYDGPLSAESATRTHQDAPSAPEDLVVSERSPSGDRGPQPQLSITWKKPAKENGRITVYNLSYTYAIEDNLPISVFTLFSNLTFNYTLTVLGGVEYTVEVFAKTIKPGPKKMVNKLVRTYRPSSPPPGIKKQKINETTFNITWQPLSRQKSNGKIISYEVKSTDISRGRQKRASSTDSEMFWNTTITARVLSGLKVCTKYLVEVRAYTTAGPGRFGALEGPIETSAPGPPTSFEELSHNETTVALKWNEPVILGEKQTFTIAYEGLKDYYPEFSDVRTVGTSTTSYTISGLYPGTKYKFSVSSTSRCGVGDNSTVLPVETEPAAPIAPDNRGVENITTSETSANVTVWNVSQINGPISFYQVIVYQVNEWTDETTDAGNNLTAYDASEQKKGHPYITAQLTAYFVKHSRYLLVGDGKPYGNFKNAELSKGKKYKIYSRALTIWNSETLLGAQGLIAQIDVEADIPVKAGSKPSTDALSGGIIAGICLVVIFLILAGVIVAGFVWKRRRQAGEEATPKIDQSRSLPLSNVSSNNLLFGCEAPERQGEVVLVEESVPAEEGRGLDGPIYSNTEPDDDSHDQPKPVPVGRFAEYVTRMKRGKDSPMIKQYKRLNNGQLFSWETAKKPQNKVKNRYGNIIAYDHSRVVLPHINGDEHSDYINANFLHGFDGTPNTYIACQGPVTGTFDDFWRMIWLQKPTVIVMLTRLLENNRVKCHQYWPERKEQYGDIAVINQKTENFADYVIRTFILSKKGSEERRQVRQFHFLAWPDKGVPQHATAVLGLRRKVRALQRNSKYPLLVHCSAGIGRTGAFVVIDAMLQSAKRKKVVDVFNYIQTIRNDRISMVQTEEQYVFIYMAILEALTCGNTEIPAQDLRIAVKKLSAVNPETSLSGFDTEFQRLELITSADIAGREDDAGRRPENASKNRFPNIVPLNEARVFLMVEEDKNYINASFVDAFREQNAFITTQAPLKNTRADFWHMVWDYNIGTVVMLNELKEQGQAYPVYWPSDDSITFDKFTLEVASYEVFQDFTERVLRLTKKGDSQTGREVRHCQVTGWPDKGAPANLQGILDLVNVVEQSQRKCSKAPPVVVHCSNGVGRSGTFCAVLSILERLKSEQVLDIFQAIKALRIKRPGAVETTAQYIFCYNIVQKYLDSFDNYANFI